MFENILAGLIVSSIVFLITFFTPKIYRFIQIKKIDKVLPISNSRIGVIIGGYTNMIPEYKHDMFVRKESVVSQNLLIELFKKYKSNLITNK